MTFKNVVEKNWVWIAIFIFVLTIGLYVRFYPLRAHIWSDTTNQATVFVLTKIKAMLTEQITAQTPNMPQAQRNALIEERFAQTVHNDSTMVRKTIAQAADNLRKLSPGGGDRVYLQEADGYYYYDLTQNIIKTGNIAREFKGSKYLNEKMAAPFGFWQPINVHPFVGFGLYKCLSLFNPNIPLVNALSYTGPVLSALALAAFILLCRILCLSPLAAGIGAAYFYLAPIFVKRSTFAWYDDDSHNLLFPLLILCAVFQAIQCIHRRRDSIIYGIVTAAVFTVYALFWHGWAFTFAVVMAGGAGILVTHCILELKFKPHAAPRSKYPATLIPIELIIFFATILFATMILVSLMFGVGGFVGIFQEGFGELRKFVTNQLSLWPNLFVAVGELKRSSITNIMLMTGNVFSFYGAILSIPLIGYIAFTRRNRAQIYQLIILTALLLVDLKITLGAERFILLCLIPLSVLFAMGLNITIELLRKKFRPTKSIETAVGAALAVLLVFVPFRSVNAQIGSLLNPIFNATWDAALLDIKQKTPPESVVTTWWPPGHFIKAVADRRVTFDGATLSKNKEAYWVANILMTSDEHKAAGILRMLNTSGTTAGDYLESQGLKTSDMISLLHYILPQTKAQAAATLAKTLPAPMIEKLLAMTHTPPPPSYVLIYSELMEKNIGLQFVGKWNFRAIEDLNNNPEALKNVPPANSPAFFEFLWKMIGGPYKCSEALIALAQDNSRIDFDQGLSVNLDTMTATINSPKYGKGTPLSIVALNGTKVVEHPLAGHSLNYSVVLFKENTRYYARLMDQELANSLLVKFFIFKGQGMELFTPLTLQKDMSGREEVDVFELRREKIN